jgi:predicted nucleic acid-binding protein
VIGWLLDTNVVAALINPNGAPSVKVWAAGQREEDMFLSVLTLGEYDKGIHNLPAEHRDRPRYVAARDALEARFGGRILAVSDQVVRRWGRMSGEVKRTSGNAPPVIDTFLAATAIEGDLYFATRNVKDARLPGVVVFDPWSDDPDLFPLSPRLGGR